MQSGHGAYHGRFSFELFSHKRAVMDKRYSILFLSHIHTLFLSWQRRLTCECSIYGDLPLRYPPWTENKVWALKHLL